MANSSRVHPFGKYPWRWFRSGFPGASPSLSHFITWSVSHCWEASAQLKNVGEGEATAQLSGFPTLLPQTGSKWWVTFIRTGILRFSAHAYWLQRRLWNIFALSAITPVSHKMAVLPQQTPETSWGQSWKFDPHLFLNNKFRTLDFSPFSPYKKLPLISYLMTCQVILHLKNVNYFTLMTLWKPHIMMSSCSHLPKAASFLAFGGHNYY